MRKRFDKKLADKARQALDGYEAPGYDPSGWQALSEQLYRRKAWLVNLRAFRKTMTAFAFGLALTCLASHPLMPEPRTGESLAWQPVVKAGAGEKAYPLLADTPDTGRGALFAERSGSRGGLEQGLASIRTDGLDESAPAQPPPSEQVLATQAHATANNAEPPRSGNALTPNGLAYEGRLKGSPLETPAVDEGVPVVFAEAPTLLASREGEFAIEASTESEEGPLMPLSLPIKAFRDNRPIRFGFALLTHSNYLPGEGYGAPRLGYGLTVDIRLTQGLYLSTGGNFTRQPVRHVSEGLSQEVYNVLSAETATMRYSEVTSGDLSILDVPLGLRCRVLDGERRRAYVSLGVSNYAYLDERYVSQKQMKDLPEGVAHFRERSFADDRERRYPAWHTFDAVATVNVSVAVEQRLGPYSGLSFEPYVKLPTRGLGSEGYRLFNVGVATRLRF